MKNKIASTDQFLGLCQEAILSVRNRQIDIAKLATKIDPSGTHVCVFNMLHNDVEFRTMWYVKLKDSMNPAECWLDVSFENWNKLSDYEMEEKA